MAPTAPNAPTMHISRPITISIVVTDEISSSVLSVDISMYVRSLIFATMPTIKTTKPNTCSLKWIRREPVLLRIWFRVVARSFMHGYTIVRQYLSEHVLVSMCAFCVFQSPKCLEFAPGDLHSIVKIMQCVGSNNDSEWETRLATTYRNYYVDDDQNKLNESSTKVKHREDPFSPTSHFFYRRGPAFTVSASVYKHENKTCT